MQPCLWRRARAIAPLASVCIAVAAVACGEVTRPSPAEHDEWAEIAAVGLRLRSEIALLSAGSRTAIGVFPHQAIPVYGAFGGGLAATQQLGAQQTQQRRNLIRHFRDKSGTLHTIGMHFDGMTRMPKFIFAFQNGRIQQVVAPVYERRGGGLYRTKARIIQFSSDGIPLVEVRSSPELHADHSSPQLRSLKSIAMETAKDVAAVFMPRPLHAAEASACLSEWVAYGTASVTLAAATATLQIATLGCLTVAGTQPVACPAAAAAFFAWNEALGKWNTALDNLAACIEKSRQSEDYATDTKSIGGDGDDGGGGGGDGGGGTLDQMEAEATATTTTVEDFINNAIKAGTFWCSDSGDYCIYLAAE